ncbi:MAG: cytochrome c3 family protein [Myxococcales bacterium]|nr:cytochrome c3 family protein [Myxococcales bacterium]
MTRPRILGALLCVIAASGCQRGRPTAAAPPSEIIFSHQKHAGEASCSDCHGDVASTTKLAGRHGPTKKKCAECHEDEVADKTKCRMCHRTPATPGKLPRLPHTPHLRFSHEAHVARAQALLAKKPAAATADGGNKKTTTKKNKKAGKAGKAGKADGDKACAVCHAKVVAAKSLDAVRRPKMRECFSACHQHRDDYRALRCTGCHSSLRDYPIKAVSAFSHAAGWKKRHGRFARGNLDACASCHRQSYCAGCHSQRAGVRTGVTLPEGSGRRFIHAADWQARHAVAARATPMTCRRCHAAKSCNRCHSARGVSASSAPLPGQRSPRSPHGAGWMLPGSPNSHGVAARRRTAQCAGCHDRGPKTNCITCHKTSARGGLGINPHPPGFSRGGKQSNSMCLYCH